MAKLILLALLTAAAIVASAPSAGGQTTFTIPEGQQPLAAAEFSQANASHDLLQWGPASSGVQMSIRIATNVVAAGSEPILSVLIRNASTNSIGIDLISDRLGSFHVSLTADGKSYDIERPKHPIEAINANGAGPIRPGGTAETTLPLGRLDPSLKPGNYVLKAELTFFIYLNPKGAGKEQHKVTSNPIELILQ